MSSDAREPTRLRHLAWAVVVVGVLGWAAAVFFGLRRPADLEPLLVSDVIWAISFAGFLSVGGLIAAHRPRNPIGWCLTVAPTLVGVGVALSEYAAQGLHSSTAIAWITIGADISSTGGFLLLVLGWLPLFPDGRPLSPRWAWLTRAVLVVVPLLLVVQALGPVRSLDQIGVVPHPIDAPALSRAAAAIQPVVNVLAVGLGVLCVAVPFVRFRRVDRDQRAQLRWLLLSLLLVCALIGLTWTVRVLLSAPSIGDVLGWLTTLTATIGLSGAVAVAVLRYRLYEIDRLISRTASYAILTVILAGIYTIGVLGLGGMVRAVTGGAGGDLIVAASTLAVAAAFGPVRRLVQRGVDQRFYRARFDATQVVQGFVQRLRDEVQLDTVAADLQAVALRATSPVSISLWLRSAEPPGVSEEE